jgi:hypothetical protein
MGYFLVFSCWLTTQVWSTVSLSLVRVEDSARACLVSARSRVWFPPGSSSILEIRRSSTHPLGVFASFSLRFREDETSIVTVQTSFKKSKKKKSPTLTSHPHGIPVQSPWSCTLDTGTVRATRGDHCHLCGQALALSRGSLVPGPKMTWDHLYLKQKVDFTERRPKWGHLSVK